MPFRVRGFVRSPNGYRRSGCLSGIGVFVVVSGHALREVATSVRVSCCRSALFEGLIGDGLLLSCSTICRHQRRVDDAAVAPREICL